MRGDKTQFFIVVDGPYAGDAIPLDESAYALGSVDLANPGSIDPEKIIEPANFSVFPAEIEYVHYHLTVVGVFSRHILLAHINLRPSQEQLFQALISDNAKKAIIT